MTPFHWFDGMVVTFNLEGEVKCIDCKADDAPCRIWDEQPLCLIRDVCFCVTRYGFIEIARLEKEKAHEEERPSHHLYPPVIILVTTESDDMQQYHANNAYTTQEIKSMVTFLHDAKVVKSLEFRV